MKLSIIIPAHNEDKTIAEILRRVAEVNIAPWEKEIIVVNDGSVDNTKSVVEASTSKIGGGEKLLLINHQANLGKGAAIKTGLEKASGDYAIIQDADLEYFPEDIPKLLQPINRRATTSGMAVFGNRGTKSYPERGFHYVFGAKLLTGIFNVLYGVWLHDLYVGYKLFPSTAITNIESNGFELEAELAAKLIKAGCKIIEAPINYKPRSHAQGKHLRPKDAIIGMWAIIKYRFYR